jgi:hypothetical protein
MYKASRAFISERQKYCSFEVRIVRMHWVEIGEQNDCFHNAVAARDIDINKSGSTENPIRSGWMVAPFDEQSRITEFVQHWWNYDPVLKQHFDTTPLHNDLKAVKLEFIEDRDLCEFGTSILNQIKSNVGRDIALKAGSWYSTEVTEGDELDFSLLENLDHKSLLYMLDSADTRMSLTFSSR